MLETWAQCFHHLRHFSIRRWHCLYRSPRLHLHLHLVFVNDCLLVFLSLSSFYVISFSATSFTLFLAYYCHYSSHDLHCFPLSHFPTFNRTTPASPFCCIESPSVISNLHRCTANKLCVCAACADATARTHTPLPHSTPPPPRPSSSSSQRPGPQKREQTHGRGPPPSEPTDCLPHTS